MKKKRYNGSELLKEFKSYNDNIELAKSKSQIIAEIVKTRFSIRKNLRSPFNLTPLA